MREGVGLGGGSEGEGGGCEGGGSNGGDHGGGGPHTEMVAFPTAAKTWYSPHTPSVELKDESASSTYQVYVDSESSMLR